MQQRVGPFRHCRVGRAGLALCSVVVVLSTNTPVRSQTVIDLGDFTAEAITEDFESLSGTLTRVNYGALDVVYTNVAVNSFAPCSGSNKIDPPSTGDFEMAFVAAGTNTPFPVLRAGITVDGDGSFHDDTLRVTLSDNSTFDANPFTGGCDFAGVEAAIGIIRLSLVDLPGDGYDDLVFETAPECFLVIGNGAGDAMYLNINHMFQTQLDVVEDSYAVLMDDIPEFVLPAAGRQVSAAVSAVGPGGKVVEKPHKSPPWMLDGEFTVQILMWNPDVFPGLPEQYSTGLHVQLLPGGNVSSWAFGESVGGITMWVELDTKRNGDKVIRFPFSVAGM